MSCRCDSGRSSDEARCEIHGDEAQARYRKREMEATEYEKLTHEGRKICEEDELRGGYCGTCSLETHVSQMRDPGSWVHVSKERWLIAAKAVAGRQEAMTEHERVMAAFHGKLELLELLCVKGPGAKLLRKEIEEIEEALVEALNEEQAVIYCP